MHRLLKRQIRKHLAKNSDTAPLLDHQAMEAFLAAVSKAYEHNDNELQLMERSNELNVEELNAVNELLKAHNAKITELATTDTLTGLVNRQAFNDRLNNTIARSRRYSRKFGILFIDLDRFKLINDTLGHHIGDMLLQCVAERLTSGLRASDTVARLGGDEFTVLLDELTNVQDAQLVAEKLLDALSEPFQLDSHELVVTASLGISVFPDDGEDLATLVKNADAAMYHAKASGRNNVQCYQPKLNDDALESATMETALRGALDRDEFRLVYQPQIDLQTGKIVGVEALIRWISPELGFVSPMQFIPMAEETGLITRIGVWVLRTACCQVRSWIDAGLDPVRMAVNISGRQLDDPNFVGTVEETLQAAGLEPEALEVELTESMIMTDSDRPVAALTAVREMGVHLSLDDFGTGYSSLTRLRRLPLDRLKIDRSFVKDLPEDHDDAIITRAIIAMGRSLGLQVVAEGVETAEQLELLANEGCHEAQGYLISKPKPSEELVPMLAQKRVSIGHLAAVA